MLGRPITFEPVDRAGFPEFAAKSGLGEGHAQMLATIFYPVEQGWTAVDSGDVQQFFRDKYRMNVLLADDPKPVVAFMQGYTMGGGVGLGGHARHRIVCESSRIAMPEVGIGLVPDVGSTWLLGHAPGEAGEFLALTGYVMGPADAIFCGFADRLLPEADWPMLIHQLTETGDPGILPPGPAPVAPLSGRNLSSFAGIDVPAIRDALDRIDPETAVTIRSKSPLSVTAAPRLVREARLDAAMRESILREYRFTSRASAQADLLEGIWAQVIDRDRSPRWTVGADLVSALLAPSEDAFTIEGRD